MFAKISNGWELTTQTWQVLKQDKALLVFPLMSGIACLAVVASFALPLWASGYAEALLEQGGDRQQNEIVGWVLLFFFYLANYFVIIFFNSALISCAIIRFKGANPDLMDGFSAASARLPQIFGWALVSATVGLILTMIESRSEKVRQIVSDLLGMAWSSVTYFVVPVIVVERVGSIAAAKRSLSILKQTWGAALTANFGIGLIVFLASLTGVLPVIAGQLMIAAGLLSVGILCIAVGVVLLLAVPLISSALNSIFIAALYLYAAEGSVPRQFKNELFQEAFSHK